MNWYKNKIVLAVGLLVILLIAGLVGFGGDDTDNEDSQVAQLQAGPVEVMGTIACLPYVSGDEDQECVKGLLGDDGRNYALNTIGIKGAERNIGQGTEVVVKGTYQPANTDSEEVGIFKYEGVIVVTSLEENE